MSNSSHPADITAWTHWFGPAPQNLLPSTPVRHVGEALVAGMLTFVVLALALVLPWVRRATGAAGVSRAS